MASARERRFLTGFRLADRDLPGLIQENDGTVWLVHPNGSRTQLPGGGGGGCEYFVCDLDNGTASMLPPNVAVILVAPTEPGVNPNISAQVTDADGAAQRALLEVGVTGDADETGYVNVSAGDPDMEQTASIQLSGSVADGGTIFVNASTLFYLLSAQSIIVAQAAEVGQSADAALGTQNPTGQTRGQFETVLSGDANEDVLTRILAQNGLGDGNDAASIELHSIVGGGGDFQLTADRLLFRRVGTPIARPEVAPASVTAQQIAEALIALGLFDEDL